MQSNPFVDFFHLLERNVGILDVVVTLSTVETCTNTHCLCLFIIIIQYFSISVYYSKYINTLQLQLKTTSLTSTYLTLLNYKSEECHKVYVKG